MCLQEVQEYYSTEKTSQYMVRKMVCNATLSDKLNLSKVNANLHKYHAISNEHLPLEPIQRVEHRRANVAIKLVWNIVSLMHPFDSPPTEHQQNTSFPSVKYGAVYACKLSNVNKRNVIPQCTRSFMQKFWLKIYGWMYARHFELYHYGKKS